MKKAFRVLAAVLLVMVFTCSCASAWSFDYKRYQKELQIKTLYRMVDSANAQVQRLIRIAQITPYDDTEWLLWSVDQTNRPVLLYAQRVSATTGLTVVCEYVPYDVDGQILWIDPLRVINVP